jgi:ABC-type oligopeptide transport system substrate-binding subunit
VQRDLGLTVEIVNVDWPEFVLGLSRREYPAYELYWGADYPDPESLLLVLFGAGRADNYVDYRNGGFDDLLREAAAEPDVAKRADLYLRAQQILLDDQVVIPLYFDVAYTLAKPAVKGLQVTPLGILGLEPVWLEH